MEILQPAREKREYHAVTVQPSVAQAAMIGNPVSFPRVRNLVEKFEALGGRFDVVQVTEQAIMDSMILANRHGHIACTQGGESFAGMLKAQELGLLGENEFCVLDSTAHALKFAGFQNMYLKTPSRRIRREGPAGTGESSEAAAHGRRARRAARRRVHQSRGAGGGEGRRSPGRGMSRKTRRFEEMPLDSVCRTGYPSCIGYSGRRIRSTRNY